MTGQCQELRDALVRALGAPPVIAMHAKRMHRRYPRTFNLPPA